MGKIGKKGSGDTRSPCHCASPPVLGGRAGGPHGDRCASSGWVWLVREITRLPETWSLLAASCVGWGVRGAGPAHTSSEHAPPALQPSHLLSRGPVCLHPEVFVLWCRSLLLTAYSLKVGTSKLTPYLLFTSYP